MSEGNKDIENDYIEDANQKDEVNNNQENEKKEIEETIKASSNLVKNAAMGNGLGAVKDTAKIAMNKKIRRKIVKSAILKILIPIIIIIFMASAILGIFNAVGDTVKDVIDTILDFFKFSKTDGAIDIDVNQVDTIINAIQGLGISVEDLKLLGDYSENATEEEKQDALRKYIKKFYEAQAVTETINLFHKESTNNKTYGAIYIYRTDSDKTDDEDRIELEYKEYDKLKEMADKNDQDALNYFSLNESGELVLASKEELKVEEGETEDDLRENKGKARVEIELIENFNYKSAISQYTTQMNFLIYLTMISQNPEFVAAVTDLIKDSRLEITVMGNVQENVETIKRTYTLHERETKTTIIGSGQTQREDKEVVENETEGVTDITRTTTTTTTPIIKLTYVKTWFCEQRIVYKKKSTESSSEPQVIGPTNETDPGGDGTWKTNIIEEIHFYTKTNNYEEYSREDVKFIIGERGDAERYKKGEIEQPTFVGLMETKFRIPYSSREVEAGSNLVSGAEMLFYLLQQDSKLENMEQIMRYALYLYSGKDYGVTSLDGSIFEIGDFITSGGGSSSSLLKEYIRRWENSGGAPTNTAGDKYIIEDDGAGNLVVGYGIDIYNGGFANLFIEAGYNLELGAEVDVDFVDNLEQQEIDSNISSVKSITAGLNLKEYQIHALVSRAYNCGVAGALSTTRGSPAMNFVNSYKTYWKETDDQFEEKNNNANFNHSLYTQYMSKPVTADGNYMAGLEKRRKSEWTLFQTGYYDVFEKWYEEGGTIIECAREIHQYMEQNSYTYCVYGSNSYEECSKYGKSHGLNRTFEESKNGYHNTCCATYVKWVLQEAGYLGEDERIRWC